MKNSNIRLLMITSGFKNYEIADKIGVNEATISRWLRTIMSDERKTLIVNAINELQEERISRIAETSKEIETLSNEIVKKGRKKKND